MSTKDKLFNTMTQSKTESRNKVTIVGSGAVGTTTAFAILMKGISNDIVLIGRNEDKVHGEILDLQDGWKSYKDNVRISGGTDISMSTGSKLIIFAAGEKRKEGESRLDLVQKNVDILKALIPKIVHCCPDAILLIATYPSDIMAFIAWKLSSLPKHHVIGCGTSLDTSRFRLLIAQKLNVTPATVCGWVIGEEGESSIPLWSTVDIAGVRLCEVNPLTGLENDEEHWSDIHKIAIHIGSRIVKLKEKSFWAIGSNCAEIASDILLSTDKVQTVSTLVKGLYKVNKEVFMSLPCKLNANGIQSVVNIKLSNEERSKLLASANLIEEIQKSLNY